MKKLALILALMLIPCTAFGLEMLNDNALDEVTGQSGVSIAMDDIQLFLHVDRFAYLDCDGYSTNSGYGGTCASNIGAGIVINNFQMDMININMIGTAGLNAVFLEGSTGLDGATTAAAIIAGVLAKSDEANTDHISSDGRTWGVSFLSDEGTRYFRNPGKQSWQKADGTLNWSGYNDFDGSFDDGTYAGSLPLASTTCGNIPLFYDYGQTTTTAHCHLTGTDSSIGSFRNNDDYNLGLNNYMNVNFLSSKAEFMPQGVTIDLTGALPLHTLGIAVADPGTNVTIGGVLIGLPTAEFHIQQMEIGDILFTADISTNTAEERSLVKNNNASYGTIVLEGITFSTFGGWIEIAPTFY